MNARPDITAGYDMLQIQFQAVTRVTMPGRALVAVAPLSAPDGFAVLRSSRTASGAVGAGAAPHSMRRKRPAQTRRTHQSADE